MRVCVVSSFIGAAAKTRSEARPARCAWCRHGEGRAELFARDAAVVIGIGDRKVLGDGATGLCLHLADASVRPMCGLSATAQHERVRLDDCYGGGSRFRVRAHRADCITGYTPSGCDRVRMSVRRDK